MSQVLKDKIRPNFELKFQHNFAHYNGKNPLFRKLRAD